MTELLTINSLTSIVSALIIEAVIWLNVTLSVDAPIVIVSVPSLTTVIPAEPETKLIVSSLPTANPSSEPETIKFTSYAVNVT